MPASAQIKEIQVVFYRRESVADCSWRDETDWPEVEAMLGQLALELKPLHVDMSSCAEDTLMSIRGYTDILNSVRLRYPAGGFCNTCLGHVIGSSAHCNLAEDLKRGINRILFAPETIEPQGSDKIVCHNCGCGC